MKTAWLSSSAPPAPRGTVYGAALNFRDALAALGDAVHAAPYGSPPRAPILYIKPRNTWISDGTPISLPVGHDAVVAGPTLGLVIGRSARRVSPASALDHVFGYTLVNDLALPHASYYRPALQQQCRDGFCAIASEVVPRAAIADADALEIRVVIDGVKRFQSSTAGMIRPVRQLISDVSEFMTLHSGDLLLTGLPANLPPVRAGQRVAIEIDGLGRLENPVISEAAAMGGT